VKNSKIIIIRQVGNKVNETKREKDKEMGAKSIRSNKKNREASHDDNRNRKNQSDVFKYRIYILFVNSML